MPETLIKLVQICNEPHIYERLFSQICEGRPYTIEHARHWIVSSLDLWRNNQSFVFLVEDIEGMIVAACDIKSAARDGALIGYWCSRQGSGVTTNAVCALCEFAEGVGYQRLLAEVVLGNNASINVLKRAQFRQSSVQGNLLLFERVLRP